MNKTKIYKLLSVLFAVFLWQIASVLVGADFLLASPFAVIKKLCELAVERKFFSTVLFSFLRISGGFLAAFLLGILLAVAASKFKIIEYFLWPFVTVAKSVPVASFIILCLIWLDFNVLTVFIAFLIVFPVVYSNVFEGIKSADKMLCEMSDFYNVPFRRRLRFIYMPSIKPFLLSASKVGIGMAWKAGVAAEVIGIVGGSVGGRLYDAKIYLQNAELLAWTLLIILISALSEKVFLLLVKKIFEVNERL
ncbi:MAG: ABC transporter permease subunit [Clostridia bacterium]|nr:ABC transporter permease subunit [Clostridia bacterium]